MAKIINESGSGKTIVLLHAFPLSNSMWKSQIDKLVEADFRIVSPDLLGFRSNTNSSEINLMEDMANHVADLLDSLAIEKAIIGGLSMGGYVTINLYRLFPEKFSAIILCDTNCESEPEEKRQLRYDLIKKINEIGTQALIENILPNLICDFTKENNEKLVNHLEKEFLKADKNGVIAALKGMAVRKDHTYLLDEIDIPTLLIFGEEDKITNIECSRKLNRLINNSKLEIIKNAGHYSNLENSTQFNSVLLNFLEDLKTQNIE